MVVGCFSAPDVTLVGSVGKSHWNSILADSSAIKRRISLIRPLLILRNTPIVNICNIPSLQNVERRKKNAEFLQIRIIANTSRRIVTLQLICAHPNKISYVLSLYLRWVFAMGVNRVGVWNFISYKGAWRLLYYINKEKKAYPISNNSHVLVLCAE